MVDSIKFRRFLFRSFTATVKDSNPLVLSTIISLILSLPWDKCSAFSSIWCIALKKLINEISKKAAKANKTINKTLNTESATVLTDKFKTIKAANRTSIAIIVEKIKILA